MKIKFKNKEGFTLLESVVVLFLVSILIGFPILSVRKAEESIKIQLFIEELTTGITLMQSHAIMNRQPTIIEVKPDTQMIDFRVYGGDSRSLDYSIIPPEEVKLANHSEKYIFGSDSGNIGQYGSFSFTAPTGEYKLVFQMGSGRFYVRKTE